MSAPSSVATATSESTNQTPPAPIASSPAVLAPVTGTSHTGRPALALSVPDTALVQRSTMNLPLASSSRRPGARSRGWNGAT